jgi:hypothetical protein
MAAPARALARPPTTTARARMAKGKGWVEMLQDECKNHGGQFQKR